VQIELVDRPQSDGDRSDELESDVDALLEEAEEFLGKSNKTNKPRARREEAQAPAEEPAPSTEGLTDQERIMLAVEELVRHSRQTRKITRMAVFATRNGLEKVLESMGGQLPPQAQNVMQGMLAAMYQLEDSLRQV